MNNNARWLLSMAALIAALAVGFGYREHSARESLRAQVQAGALRPIATLLKENQALIQFRNYVSAWRDRWNSVVEIFMAGGNYPAAAIPFPPRFWEVVQRELKTSR